jgi:MFS transporter, DHA1 family, inner membrane transport protein
MKSYAAEVSRRPAGTNSAALLMFALLLASYSLNAMDRQIFPLVAADVRREFGFSLAQTGLLSTIFTLGMAIAGVPTGLLLARMSRKAAVIIGLAIFSIGTVLMTTAHSFTGMLLYRAMTGIGEAMQLTVILAIGTSYFRRFRSTAVGSINFAFGIGAILGPACGGAILAVRHSWRLPMVVFGLLGFVAIALIGVAVRPWLTETSTLEEPATEWQAADSMRNHNTVLLTVLSLIGGMVIYGYLGMYPTFLREHMGFTPAVTGGVMGAYGLGVLASIAGGWVGDRISARWVLGGGFAVTALLGYGLFHAATTLWEQSALSFCWGLIVSGVVFVNLGGYHIRSVSSHLNAKASGIFVSSLYCSAAIAGYSIGWLATHAGWSLAGLLQISALSSFGALLSLALKPSGMSVPVGKAPVEIVEAG